MVEVVSVLAQAGLLEMRSHAKTPFRLGRAWARRSIRKHRTSQRQYRRAAHTNAFSPLGGGVSRWPERANPFRALPWYSEAADRTHPKRSREPQERNHGHTSHLLQRTRAPDLPRRPHGRGRAHLLGRRRRLADGQHPARQTALRPERRLRHRGRRRQPGADAPARPADDDGQLAGVVPGAAVGHDEQRRLPGADRAHGLRPAQHPAGRSVRQHQLHRAGRLQRRAPALRRARRRRLHRRDAAGRRSS